MHSDMVMRLARRQARSVRKPMDITVDKILAIEEVRKETGLGRRRVQNRRNAVMEPTKKAVEEGRLGEIYTGLFRSTGIALTSISSTMTAGAALGH